MTMTPTIFNMRTAQNLPAAGSLFRRAPMPATAMTYRFLAPELSAQLTTAPTGRAELRGDKTREKRGHVSPLSAGLSDPRKNSSGFSTYKRRKTPKQRERKSRLGRGGRRSQQRRKERKEEKKQIEEKERRCLVA